MSCPRSVSSHPGHLEPTTMKPNFTSTSTVINMVLASLHHHCGQAACWALGLLHPGTWVGLGQWWLSFGLSCVSSSSLGDSPLDCVCLGHQGCRKSSLDGQACVTEASHFVSLSQPLLPCQGNSV